MNASDDGPLIDYRDTMVRLVDDIFDLTKGSDPAGQVADKWFTRQTPRAFLLDSNGALLYRGAIDNYKFPDDPEYIAYLEPALEQFLKGEPIARPETASYGCAIQSVYYTLGKAL